MSNQADDEVWMRRALELAQEAYDFGEVPVGAVVVLNGKVIGEGFNRPIALCNPTAHAEMLALQSAGEAINNYRLAGADIYVTLEPCAMCAAAMVHARIRRLIFGAREPKAGCAVSQRQFFSEPFLNHHVEVCGGVLADESTQLLQSFFKMRREQQRQDRTPPSCS